MGEGIGKAIRNFKKSVNEREEINIAPKKSQELLKGANKP